MVATVPDLLDLLDLEQIEVGLFRGKHPVTQRQRSFGGQVLAQALIAVGRTIPEDRQVHSMHAYFLRPGRTDRPMIFDVEMVRDGGSFTTRRVVVRQDGQAVMTLTASCQVLEEGLDHQDLAPSAPPPEDCEPMSAVMSRRTRVSVDAWNQEFGVLDVRWIGDSRGLIPAESHASHARVWVKVIDEVPADPILHTAITAYASDLTLLGVSTVPHPVAFSAKEIVAASLDHAMWFHRPLRVDDWWLYDQISPSASNGRGFSLARLYQDGMLTGSAAQEGLIRIRRPRPGDQTPDRPA